MDTIKKKCLMGLIVFLILLGFQAVYEATAYGITDAVLSISLDALSTLNAIPEHFSSITQSIIVTTDNYTGYNLSLINPSGSTDLINTTDNTLIIPTITLPSGSSSITPANISEGYGISLDGTNYTPAPTAPSGIQIASTNTSGSNTHTITYGVKPDVETESGIYSKTFSVVAVVNNPQYSVSFNANAGTDTVTNMPSNQGVTISSTGDFTLPSDVPTRENYNFLGWDTNSTATTPTYPTGNTNLITLEPTQANTITLYAIWEYIPEPVIADYTESFSNVEGPSASVTTDLTNGGSGMSPSEYITKIFAYVNGTGRTISSISVEIVYSKSNQGSTSGYLIGKLNVNGTEYSASPVSVGRSKVTNQHLEVAQFNNLNIPSSSNVSFTIGTDSDAFSAGITISSQTVTVTFAD